MCLELGNSQLKRLMPHTALCRRCCKVQVSNRLQCSKAWQKPQKVQSMALKNSKFSHLTRTHNKIPLAGKDGLTTPPEQSEVKLSEQGEGQRQIPTAESVSAHSQDAEGPSWKTKLQRTRHFLSKNAEKIGLYVCIATAVLLIGAVVCSTMSVRHYKKAQKLIEVGNFKQALPELNSAIWFNPNLVGALYDRAQINSQAGDTAAAFDDYSRAIKVNPFYKDVLERRAAIYSNQGDWRNAILDYNVAISSSNNPRTSLFASRAQAYSKTGDYNAAVADYDVAISHAAKNPSLYLGRAQACIKLRRYKDALRDCEIAAELDPRNEAAYVKRAWCKHFLDNHGEAIKDINLALEINPQARDAHYYRGTFLFRDGNYAGALADLERAVQLNNKDPRCYLLRGEAYSHLGDKRKAIADLEKALKLPPLSIGDIKQDFTANLAARLYMDIGDYKNAAKKLTAVIENSPQDADSLIRRAKCYIRMGSFSQALADCDAAIALKPDRAEYYCTRAVCQAKLGRLVGAEHDFDKALSLTPRSFDVYMARGNFYLDRKDLGKAADDFSEATRINPRSPTAKSKLAFTLGLGPYKRKSSVASQLSPPSQDTKATPDADDAALRSKDLNVLLSSGYRDLARGRSQKSIEKLSRAVQLFPNDARARRYLAYALLEGHQPIGALEQFKQLAALGQQTSDDQVVMADALTESGRPKEAIRLCKRCLETDANNTKVYAKMARAYAALGFPEKAVQVCQEGMEHASSTAQQEELETVRAEISTPAQQAPVQQQQRRPSVKPAPAGDVGG